MKRTLRIGMALLILCVGAWGLLPLAAEDPSAKPTKGALAVQALRKQVRQTHLTLMVEGKYSCCISPGCSFCTLALGRCPCAQRLVKGTSVCHSCKGGWDAGHGSVPDVNADAVAPFTGKELKEIYAARKEALKRKRRRR